MIRRIQAAFRLQHDYRDPYERIIAQDLLRYVTVLAAALAVGLVLPTLLGVFDQNITLFLVIVVLYSFLFTIGLFVQIGRVYTARNLLLVMTALAVANSAFQFSADIGIFVSFLTPLVVAGLLTSRWVTVAVAALVIGLFVYVLAGQPVVVIEVNPANRANVLFSVILNVVLIAQFLVVFGAGQQRVAQAFSRDIRSFQRALELNTLDERSIDEPTLIEQSLRSLKSGFDRVQIYLVEQSTGARATPYYQAFDLPGVQAGQPIDLSASSAVSEVVRSAEILIITPESSDQRQRHLAPGMQMAVLVPLISDEQVLGVLDFQLSMVTTFSPSQIEVFRSYGRRLGIALARTRLIRQLYADVQLQQSVIAGLRQRIEALERSTRAEVDASTWQRYFQEVASGALGYDIGAGAAVLPLDQLPASTYASLHMGHIVTQPNGDGTHVVVPIRLRDVLLGALTFQMPSGKEITQRQQELIQSVVDRLALALENRRLLQQSQAQAQREAKASQVGSLLFSTTDMTTLLNTAASEFNEALGAVNTAVRVLNLEANEPS
jgi:GAF domain-containing protein